MTASLTIEPETSSDEEAIRQLNTVAFDGRTEEADLVDGLREAGDLLLSLVARREGALIGHLAFSRVTVDASDGPAGAVALAPVAVHPAAQNEGVGRSLIERGMIMLAEQGETLVLVVGNPAYYTRFGFSTELGRQFPSVYSGPHYMAAPVGEGGPSAGTVTYPEAFALVN